MLEKLGYTVSLAENGLKAVQAFDQFEYDLILMDVQMPEMGGFEATAKIREIEASRKKSRTPIIAMTAHAIQGYREKCLEGGMDGYISKPIHMESVKKTIEEYIDKGKKHLIQAQPIITHVDKEKTESNIKPTDTLSEGGKLTPLPIPQQPIEKIKADPKQAASLIAEQPAPIPMLIEKPKLDSNLPPPVTDPVVNPKLKTDKKIEKEPKI
jgi:CheY-like chemotaxis protein